jgi:hypothetical protein
MSQHERGMKNRIRNQEINKCDALTENCVLRIHGDLILRRLADETLGIRERNIRRSRSISLFVSNDLDTIVLPHSHAAVRGPEVDADRRSFSSHVRFLPSPSFAKVAILVRAIRFWNWTTGPACNDD